jgi:hypothetical protein
MVTRLEIIIIIIKAFHLVLQYEKNKINLRNI